MRNKEKCDQILPLDSVLKVFLELPSVFYTVRDYYLNLMQQDNSIHNIVQTNFWKSKIIEYPDRIIFPLFAYEDGYETGNTLGSHAGVYNSNGIYILFPCLRPEFRSKLANIFLSQLHHAYDAANVNKNTTYGKLISDLNELNAEGIEICVDRRRFRVYFKVV